MEARRRAVVRCAESLRQIKDAENRTLREATHTSTTKTGDKKDLKAKALQCMKPRQCKPSDKKDFGANSKLGSDMCSSVRILTSLAVAYFYSYLCRSSLPKTDHINSDFDLVKV